MPLVFLERLPWPSLQTYIALSVVLLVGSVYSGYSTLTDFRLKASSLEEASHGTVDTSQHPDRDEDSEVVLSTVAWYLVNDNVYVWVSLVLVTLSTNSHSHMKAVLYMPFTCAVLHHAYKSSFCFTPKVLVNTACCTLMVIAKIIQWMVFGALRVSEKQVRLFI